MKVTIRELEKDEWILLHDFYSESSEPDAPQNKYETLNADEKLRAKNEYSSKHFRAVCRADSLIGFVGFSPDDDDNINLFYVISPDLRGKGYFTEVLKASLQHCRENFKEFRHLRSLTRIENTPSIHGLQRFSFIRKGSIVEDVQPDVTYEEYLLPL